MNNRRLALVCVLLAGGTMLLYARTAQNGFVGYDDPVYVTRNPHVQGGLTPEGIVWAFTSFDAANWHPLTWLSHMLDVDLLGMRPDAQHLVNALIHSISSALLLVALFRMTGAIWRSALAAAIFAVHPLRVESVAWIAERKDVLAAMFWMLTLLAYQSYVARQGVQRYLLVALCLLLGLLAKPMLVTLPFVLLLLDWWPLGRFIRDGATGQPATCAIATRRIIVEKLPLLALSIGSCVITYLAQHRGGAVVENVPLSLRFSLATVGVLRYIGKIFWPTNLSVLYPLPDHLPAFLVAGCATVILIVTLAAILLLRSRHYVAVGWFWFLGTLVPVIGIVQVGAQSIADRYTYIPAIGLTIAIVWGLADLVARLKIPNPIRAIGAATILATFCAATSNQIDFWRDTMTLFRHTLRATRDNYIAHSYVGSELARTGQRDAAIAEFREAIRIKIDYAEAHFNLANTLSDAGDVEGAIHEYEQAVKYRPNLAEAYLNIGRLRAGMGQMTIAAASFAKAVVARPDFAEAHESFGQALLALGDVDGAVNEFKAALKLRPDSTTIRQKLDRAIAQQHAR